MNQSPNLHPMYSEPAANRQLAAIPSGEQEPGFRVTFDETRDAPVLGKGQSAEKLPRNVLALDTGTPIPPSEDLRHPESQERIDAVYRETIRRGIIDHHAIDATTDIPADKRRCTTTMIADFPDDVLAMMRERGVDRVTSHFESDLDSLCASYLAKSLLEHGHLPSIAGRLSEFVNRVDYGRYEETDPDKFLKSVLGASAAIENSLNARRDAEVGAIWRDPDATREEKAKLARMVRTKYQNLLMKAMFDLLNAAEAKDRANPGSVDFADLDVAGLPLAPELKTTIAEGSAGVKDDFRKFEQVWGKAEKTEMTVRDKQGNERRVRLIIVDLSAQPDLSPLAVTNIAYQRIPPEAIVAVYAGPGRKKGGDQYDIGMKPESTEIFDLKFLEKTLNEAEAERRKPIIDELEKKAAEGTATPEEQAKLAKWKTPRQGFEHLGHGDPTVSVAGNSLIAASTTSLLDFAGFRAALEKARQKPAEQA